MKSGMIESPGFKMEPRERPPAPPPNNDGLLDAHQGATAVAAKLGIKVYAHMH